MNLENTKLAVIGGGSWATAIVKILTEKPIVVHWYMRSNYAIEHIKRTGHNPNYLTSVQFDVNQLGLSSDINAVVSSADTLIFAIPSAFLAGELKNVTEDLSNKSIFSAIKGIVPESGQIVGQYLIDHHKVPSENIGVITGPCHAEEVALERLSYLTIASGDKEKAEKMAQCLANQYIKVKISDDIIGAEYAGMLKNIYAIAAGMAHGLGYGDNFQSVLMSNSIREMKRFIGKVHKIKRNISDSAYLGDLLVTGYSTFSRNRMLGNMIGKGYTVKSAMMEMNMVAEGYYAVKNAHQLMQKRQKKSKTPIIDAVYEVLYKNKDVNQVFKQLTEKLD